MNLSNLNFSRIKNIFIIVLVILLTVLYYNNPAILSERSRVAKATYKDAKKEYKENQEKRDEKIDSLQKEIDKRDVEYQILLTESNELDKQMLIAKDKQRKIPPDIIGLKKYYEEKYKTTVIANEKSLTFTEATSTDISYDLETGILCAEMDSLKSSKINIQDKQIVSLEEDKKSLNKVNEIRMKENEDLKSLNESAENNIKALTKENHKRKTGGFIKNLIIPVSFALGFILGTK